MNKISLSKIMIAESQLEHAIDLFLEGDELISVITLAGAVEEILGKMVKSKDQPNALEERIENMCGIFKQAYDNDEEPDKKKFVSLSNQARDEMKHYRGGEPFSVN